VNDLKMTDLKNWLFFFSLLKKSAISFYYELHFLHPSPVCFTLQTGAKRVSDAFDNLEGDLDFVSAW
jgi:hypothetical protein